MIATPYRGLQASLRVVALLSVLLSVEAHCATASMEWRLSAPMPEARAGYAAGVVEGQLLVAGGTYWLGDPGAWMGKVFCATTQAFDPVSETWTRLPDAPVKFGYAAGAATEDRLYVLGGVQDGRPSGRVLVLEKHARVFHWREGPPLPEARVFAEAAVVQGKIFVVGGSREFETMDDTGLCCASLTATTTVWSLDPGDPAATWERHAPFPGHRRWSHRLAAVGRYLYQFGGRFLARKDQPVQYFNEVWRYDTRSDEWAKVAEMPVEIQLARAVQVDGVIALVGRDKCSIVFDPSSGSFASIPGLPEDALVDYFAWIPPFLVGAGGGNAA
jgi:N-acetylneuraminic acid mutarotase